VGGAGEAETGAGGSVMDDALETGAVGGGVGEGGALVAEKPCDGGAGAAATPGDGGAAVAETLGDCGAAVAETLGDGAGGSSCIRGHGALISSLRFLPMTRPCRRVFTAVNVAKLILPRR
jgi:hypothetical protein